MYEVTLKQLAGFRALTCKHIGPYMQIGNAFDQLGGWLAANNAMQAGMRMIAIYFDDPAVVPEEKLRSCAGFVFPDGMPVESPFEAMDIQGGTYAVLRHQGPYGALAQAYQWLYGSWLPQSGREAANAPAFEEYLNTPRNAAPPDLLTDICVPLS